MKKVAMKGSGLPKASILTAPAKKGAMKVAKAAGKIVAKKAAKSLMTKRAK